MSCVSGEHRNRSTTDHHFRLNTQSNQSGIQCSNTPPPPPPPPPAAAAAAIAALCRRTSPGLMYALPDPPAALGGTPVGPARRIRLASSSSSSGLGLSGSTTALVACRMRRCFSMTPSVCTRSCVCWVVVTSGSRKQVSRQATTHAT